MLMRLESRTSVESPRRLREDMQTPAKKGLMQESHWLPRSEVLLKTHLPVHHIVNTISIHSLNRSFSPEPIFQTAFCAFRSQRTPAGEEFCKVLLYQQFRATSLHRGPRTAQQLDGFEIHAVWTRNSVDSTNTASYTHPGSDRKSMNGWITARAFLVFSCVLNSQWEVCEPFVCTSLHPRRCTALKHHRLGPLTISWHYFWAVPGPLLFSRHKLRRNQRNVIF